MLWVGVQKVSFNKTKNQVCGGWVGFLIIVSTPGQVLTKTCPEEGCRASKKYVVGGWSFLFLCLLLAKF